MASTTEEITIKDLGKKVLKVCRRKKKLFLSILIGIMVLSGVYFTKVVLKPSYKSEVVLKSRFLRKDVFVSILDYYNASLKNDYENMNDNLKSSVISLQIAKLEAKEIKAEITSPDKDDKTKYYRFTMIHYQKPSVTAENNFKIILDDIKQKVAVDQDVTISKKRTEEAIVELDSLLKTALPAGDAFKEKLNSGSSMLVLSDLYRSLNDLLTRKSGLKTELQYYQTENLIYQVSPIVLTKVISFPLIIFGIGFAIWLLICISWVGFELVFGDDD
ncbi:MAG: hypothetical protein JNL75_11500 [Chitinophagales bacterium]|nr:hypothetical protein [Chitinophagales bacterium]